MNQPESGDVNNDGDVDNRPEGGRQLPFLG